MTLDDAYDPEAFRAAGHRLVDGLAEHLTRALGRDDAPVLAQIPPERLLEEIDGGFPATPTDDLVDTLLSVAARSNRLHHPRYIGHQVAPVLPQATLAELTTALLNNGMAIYEMGQPHTIMEHHVVRFLIGKLGFPGDADGVLTNGGSIGNLTALLAARQAKAGHDVWTEGQREPYSVLVSDQNHYCIARAVQMMGWGAEGLVQVETDDAFRLRPDALPGALARAREGGRTVLGVVANSCSTATGSFDPIEPIADFCQAEDLWLHVDGAHGASFVMSAKHRHLLAGVERADSVVWDLHKMMMLPALNTAVLFRSGRRSYEAFAQEASYLFERSGLEAEWFNLGHRTMECTKRGLGVTAYAMLRSLGTDVFEAYLDRMVDLTRDFADVLRASDDFELAVEPQGNIVCFRQVEPSLSPDELDELQARLRREVLREGRFYVVQAGLRGRLFLRLTVIHPMTTLEDMRELLGDLRRLAGRPG
jgi:L-2,4-diaminobutyrate decarboxylase